MKDRENWLQLCALASVEQDPEKLILLIKEIKRLLEEQQQRLVSLRDVSAGPTKK